jgi:hypothetical protein
MQKRQQSRHLISGELARPGANAQRQTDVKELKAGSADTASPHWGTILAGFAYIGRG